VALSKSTEEKLRTYREEVDKSKTALAQAQGAKAALLKRLKEEFGLDSVDAAAARLKAIEKEKQALEKSIAEKLAAIEANYDFSL
jgi:hypothetical protein